MTGKRSFFLFVMVICSVLVLSVAVTSDIQDMKMKVSSSAVLQKKVYVFLNRTSYFYYEVFSDTGNIIVQVLDQDGHLFNVTFNKYNKMYFRLAYNKHIIVEEKDYNGKSVTYWVLTLFKDKGFFKYSRFSVSSTVDNQGSQIDNSCLLKRVMEYDLYDKYLYVLLDCSTKVDVFKMDLVNYGSKLLIQNWFYYNLNQKERIVGGNSALLIQATNDQIWTDTGNQRDNISVSTIYQKNDIKFYTQLPIYPGGSQVFTLFDSYFQYVSLSADQLNMTTLTLFGYNADSQAIKAEGSLKSSSTPIKFFADEQTYFVGVADNDVYFLSLILNIQTQQYDVLSSNLIDLITDSTERSKWIQYFSQALLITYQEGTFFILTKEKFLVLSQTETHEEVLDINQTKGYLQPVLFAHIKKYKGF